MFCRCTSCRDDVVTMAAKPRERKQEERDGGKQSKKTNPVPNPVPVEERRRGEKGRGEGEGERTRGGWIKEEMLMSVFTLPDPLISSPLSVWLLISVVESIVPGHQRLRINPTHPLFDLPVQMTIITRDGVTTTDSSGEAQKPSS